ncbi:MAG: hypothetical protein M1489_06835 [Firmicutes bacterium]|nr:hypothetical protein [Bacillota bacterium]
MVITERDRQIFNFFAKWRFGTIAQLRKAGIFSASDKRCYKRLLLLRNSGLIQSIQLAGGQTYYHLLPKSGEIIGLKYPWYSSIFRGAGDSTAVQYLVFCDYAQAAGIDYLSTEESLRRISASNYDVLKKIIKSHDRFYEQNGLLHAMVVDFGLSMKYLAERAGAYARLPVVLRESLVVVFLTFNDAKKDAVARAVNGSGLKVKLLKANWKY